MNEFVSSVKCKINDLDTSVEFGINEHKLVQFNLRLLNFGTSILFKINDLVIR